MFVGGERENDSAVRTTLLVGGWVGGCTGRRIKSLKNHSRHTVRSIHTRHQVAHTLFV